MYTLGWVANIAVGVLEDGKPRFALALEEGQTVPEEFKAGDDVTIESHPARLANIAGRGMSNRYYEVKHVRSGKVLRIRRRAYEYDHHYGLRLR